MSEVMRAHVTLHPEGRYRFRVEMGRPEWSLVVDEPPPLGEGAGPNPARLFATALGHCLASSLRYCLDRARVGGEVSATVDVEVRRNERGRWRIARVEAQLDLSGVDLAQRSAVERCLGLFEDFCIVTASVRQGIPVDVRVQVNGEPTTDPQATV
ncbi:MAG: OsmC family protein [Armatimonadota bacterium]|nr:OsmC family protein [Armatimonadota bacterium]MDR7440400.1 OsmC family protein [Armatimonadota bacterium]MDR7568363.1 OsmC family protein [Armatimonadota bacterium]MDR7602525.1 OsmC family protein [Armatimonadota bacterium]